MSKEEIILKLIQKKVNYVIDGYDVIWQEADGCDEDGFKYWVECKNGFSARSWDISEAMYKSLNYLSNYIYRYGIRFSMIEDGIKGPKRTYFIKDISLNIKILKLSDIVVIDDEEYNKRIEELEQAIIVKKILNKMLENNSYYRHSNNLKDIKLCKTFDEIKCYYNTKLGAKKFSSTVLKSNMTKYHKKMLLDKKVYSAYIILKKWNLSKYNPNTPLFESIMGKKINNLLKK